MAAYQGLYFITQCAISQLEYIFHSALEVDHKHGKMLSDHRDAGLEQIWPRMAF